MQMRLIRWGVVLTGAALAVTACGQDYGTGQKESAKASKAAVGKPAPDFELTAADGKQHKLSDYQDKIVVLEWINQECPVSNFTQGAGPKMKKLSEKYAEKGIVWLAIDSTHNHTAQQNVDYIKKHGIPYPILMDSDGKVGRQYDAQTTPHMFVVNKGTLAYMGAHDNKGDRNYIEEALDALLAAKDVPSPQTKSYGCSVKYKR